MGLERSGPSLVRCVTIVCVCARQLIPLCHAFMPGSNSFPLKLFLPIELTMLLDL